MKINIALVGYRKSPLKSFDDLALYLPGDLEGEETPEGEELHFCHVDIIETRGRKKIEDLVTEMLGKNPDVLHYANFRDQYPLEENNCLYNIDEKYLSEVINRSNLGILLTSAHQDAKTFAERLGIVHMDVPFKYDAYFHQLHELANKKNEPTRK